MVAAKKASHFIDWKTRNNGKYHGPREAEVRRPGKLVRADPHWLHLEIAEALPNRLWRQGIRNKGFSVPPNDEIWNLSDLVNEKRIVRDRPVHDPIPTKWQ